MRRVFAAAALVAAMCGAAEAQELTQKFGNWTKKKAGGVEYNEAAYTVTDKSGKVVRQDFVWHLTNDPKGQATNSSNWWIYWYSPEKQAIWGRCPTPKNPQYKNWVKNLGPDLWCVIPPEKQIKGETTIWKVVPGFSPLFSAAKDKKPTVTAGSSELIKQPDYSNAIFK